MPKQVDHKARRRQIAEAVTALISEGGLEAATLREIAARAGVSMGAVQRCFSTKEEMMVFVHEHLGELATAQIEGRIAASGAGDDPVAILTETVRGITPLTAEDLPWTRAWLVFAAQAATDPRLAAVQREANRGLFRLLSVLVRAGVDAGGLRAGLDPETTARDLLALTDGLGVQVLVGVHTVATARESVERALAALRP
ncbi:HTH-type transcriptional regulator PksA [Actinorhabdospora filicis]|uniref:HTH-type transcriptional regulator PksA n=1 Tax=Actinorhabdospora filicis TaxID=1785913 RepID=A0A9W6SG54_9ACTN|nr:TetR/AcrR family transcriptional regulator [Actinorhabdospora filicis]GLZ75405.1 HTH-type transcriptional regulator PksA [Actinorhabdospora filicis]